MGAIEDNRVNSDCAPWIDRGRAHPPTEVSDKPRDTAVRNLHDMHPCGCDGMHLNAMPIGMSMPAHRIGQALATIRSLI
jgi:hypothetical protein